MKVTESNKKNKSNTKIYMVFAVIIVASLVGGFFAGKLVGASKSIISSMCCYICGNGAVPSVYICHRKGIRRQ